MFIEDLIELVADVVLVYTGTTVQTIDWSGPDRTIIESIGVQLTHGHALTEKQAYFALRTLTANKDKIRPVVPNINDVLENPKWKKPFRVLPKVKSIRIEQHESRKKIFVEFPYDQDIIDLLKKRNSDLHEIHRGQWSTEQKLWIYGLTERNIAYIGDILIPRGFTVTEEFAELYSSVTEIVASAEKYLPMVSWVDDKFAIINAHKNIPQPKSDELAEVLFHAKSYGIETWDDTISALMEIAGISKVTKRIIAHTTRTKPLWIDDAAVPINEFSDLLKYGGPAIVIVPGGNELPLLQQWVTFAISLGIDVEQISVMFRLPSDKAEFNMFVKDASLNNPVTENTQLAFVSTKITKPLVKSGVKFTTVINLGYYNYVHSTMNTVVDNATNLVYYSMKEPARNTRWRQLEL
jgi:hypothetical protein